MKTDTHTFNKKTIKILSILSFAISILGLFFLVKKQLIISNNPFAIFIQISAFSLMIWARITFGFRSFHASANSTAGGIVTSGPYKYFRHPIYASVIFFFLASLIAFPYLQTVFGVVLITGGLWGRMLLEEKSLLATYPEYESYLNKTKRIIPFIF